MLMQSLARIPSSPVSRAAGGRLNPRDNFVRTVTSLVAGKVTAGGADAVMRSLYRGDEVSPLVLRAAVAGATTTEAGWAGSLAAQAVSDFMLNLGPSSAGSQLLRSGMLLKSQPGELGFSIPGMISGPGGAGFIGEGAPIPLRHFPLTATTLAPKKLAAICVFSHEMARASNVEAFVRAALIENIGVTLDSILLGTTAASSIAAGGLRAGVTALTATTCGGTTAMLKDIGALVAAVAPVAGTSIAIVASPAEAAKLLLWAAPGFPYPILSSGGLAAGTVMAVALPALAVAMDETPEIDVSASATLHFEDATPLQISTAGSPNTVAAPVRSGFQTAAVAVRIILGVSWTLRTTGAVAHITGATW
jgi:hypothetical protein